MRSALTRHVFRQLLRNEPLSHPQCLRVSQRQVFRSAGSVQTRSLFGFGRPKPRRQLKPQSIDPGFKEMMELTSLLKQRARPPPRGDVVQAFTSFFTQKPRSRLPVSDLQAEHALVAFKHLQETGPEGKSGLNSDVLHAVLKTIAAHIDEEVRPGSSTQRLELVDLVYQESLLWKDDYAGAKGAQSWEEDMLLPYLKILGACGRGADALALLDGYWQADAGKVQNPRFWNHTLYGLARKDNEEEVDRFAQTMRARGIPYDATAQLTVISAFKNQDDMAAVKRWYVRPLDNGQQPESRTKLVVLRLCIKHNEFEWGTPILTDILEQQEPSRAEWNLIFQWAAARGKGVEEVERMIEVMKRRSADAGKPITAQPDTINALVEVANSKNDSYMAERFISLGQHLGIKPNAETRMLQMEYRLRHGDLDGAMRAYRDLQTFDVEGGQDVRLANKLILTLCQQEGPNVQVIMDYVTDLIEQNARFEPATVAALCRIHMARDELHDAIDLIQTHALHFSSDERALIRDTIVAFCLGDAAAAAAATATSISHSWDAYVIVHELFPETPRTTREQIMDHFFAHGRPDMAMHVFGHMRQSPHAERRPTAQTYRACFEGIALCGGDEDVLGTVHNMLKLDYEVDPDTRLLSALMMAHASVGRPGAALDLWEDILLSQEGPTYNSIRIALMACEQSPFGDERARAIWNKLEKLGVEVTPEMQTSYAWALAGQSHLEEAIGLMERMDREMGTPPDATALGILYNVSPGQERKTAVREWAAKNYPQAWAAVEAMGMRTVGRLVEYEVYNVRRGVRA